MFWPAASPAGWPPAQHGAAARQRRAAAPKNTTDLHSETLCIELVLTPPPRLGIISYLTDDLVLK